MLENVIEECNANNVGDDPERQSGCSAIAGWLCKRLGPLKVIEIGTSYGRQLKTFMPYVKSAVCIDPMYEWVPNVQPVEGWEPHRVSDEKVQTWWKNVWEWREKVELIIDSSYLAHKDPKNEDILRGAQVLIIDGCHHPDDSVRADYENFRRFMTSPHYVIWDDISLDDVKKAASSFDGPFVDVFDARLMYK